MTRPWHSLELREVRPEAAVQQVFRHWPGRRHRFADFTRPAAAAVALAELLGDPDPGAPTPVPVKSLADAVLLSVDRVLASAYLRLGAIGGTRTLRRRADNDLSHAALQSSS